MIQHWNRVLLVVLGVVATVVGMGLPAVADHTSPNGRITAVPANPPPAEPGLATGEGEWDHIANFPGNIASDVKFFAKDGIRYATQGTLGQGPARTLYVGQRIVQLTDEAGELNPVHRADHGSAACNSPATSATGLQHDAWATPQSDPEVLVDATDAAGRCHDTAGGGIELIDISGINDPEFEPREIHLMRFNGYTHTLTVDPARPHIVFSNSSNADGMQFLDFMDIRTCLTQSNGGTLPDDADLEAKRAGCRPKAYRIPFEEIWTQGTQTLDGEPSGAAQQCHDTVIDDNTLYCSGLHGDVLLDLTDLTDENGTPRGTPLPCAEPIVGTNSTGAMVTDCALGGPTVQGTAANEAWEAAGSPAATGWKLLGFYNHVGRNDPSPADSSNTNTVVPADQGVAVSHETRPVPLRSSGDRKFMVVSDERGGGVVPGGATCPPEDSLNPYGHSGLHFLDITDPANIEYAQMVDENGETVMNGDEPARAFWRGEVVNPQPTFCVVHRFRFLPGEQRIIMGYYSQGVKILDYDIDEQGRFSFTETASFLFKDSVTWTGDVFDYVDNADGTRTYRIAMSDTLDGRLLGNATRGMDILTWTHTPNLMPTCGDNVPEAPYRDRPSVRDAHKKSVDCATFRDIVRGFSGNTYGPAQQVRRDQMASFIAQTIDTADGAQALPPASQSEDRFGDIAGNPHADNIKRLYAAGIIKGRSNQRYAPGELVPRDQMTTFVLRAAEYAAGLERGSLDSQTQAFPDVSSSNTHYRSVNGAAESELLRGRDGKYFPTERIARDQMASFVINVLTAVESRALTTQEPVGEPSEEPTEGSGAGGAAASGDAGLGLAAAVLLPSAVLIGRRRRRR